MLCSYFETQIEYFEVIRDSGFDEDAVEAFNRQIQWVKGKDGEDVMLPRIVNSFSFYSEPEFFSQYRMDSC